MLTLFYCPCQLRCRRVLLEDWSRQCCKALQGHFRHECRWKRKKSANEGNEGCIGWTINGRISSLSAKDFQIYSTISDKCVWSMFLVHHECSASCEGTVVTFLQISMYQEAFRPASHCRTSLESYLQYSIFFCTTGWHYEHLDERCIHLCFESWDQRSWGWSSLSTINHVQCCSLIVTSECSYIWQTCGPPISEVGIWFWWKPHTSYRLFSLQCEPDINIDNVDAWEHSKTLGTQGPYRVVTVVSAV